MSQDAMKDEEDLQGEAPLLVQVQVAATYLRGKSQEIYADDFAPSQLTDDATRRQVIRDARPDTQTTGRFQAFFKQFVNRLLGREAGAPAPVETEEAREAFDEALARLYKDHDKINKVLGNVFVESQADISHNFADNALSTLLQVFEFPPDASLSTEDRIAHRRLQRALTQARAWLELRPDEPLSNDDLRKLLNSDDKSDRDLGMAVLSAASIACKHPKVIEAAMKDSRIAPIRHNLTGPDAVAAIEVQTSFIKAARQKITNLAFDTEVARRFREVAANYLDNPDDIDRFYANVGFNRVMSPQNMLGASLSSDIDFKLCIDDRPKSDGSGLRDLVRNKVIKDLGPDATAEDIDTETAKRFDEFTRTDTGALYNALKGAAGTFEQEFSLTLEVDSFALKSLSMVEKHAQNIEAEKTFLCTAFENQTLMSGNDEVRKAFVEIIRKNLVARAASDPNEPGLPIRAFNQYLGQSDKGSILSIQYLSQLEDMVNKIALACPEEEGLDNPGTLYKRLGDPEFVKKLKSRGLLDALPSEADVPLFKTDPNAADQDAEKVKRMKLLAKNLKAFTAGDGRHNFIGNKNTPSSDWVYTNKYGGCRLNDFFDAASRDRYLANKGVLDRDGAATALLPYSDEDRSLLAAKYDNSKHVARAVNRFAVQLQDRIYELYLQKGKSHADIDLLYDKVTAEQFAMMLADPSLRENLKKSIDAMVAELDALDAKVHTGKDLEAIKAYRAGLAEKVSDLKKVASDLDQLSQNEGETDSDFDARRRKLGHKLFDTTQNIVSRTAELLDPNIPQSDAAETRDVSISQNDPTYRRKSSLSGTGGATMGGRMRRKLQHAEKGFLRRTTSTSSGSATSSRKKKRKRTRAT